MWEEFPCYASGSDVDLIVFDRSYAIQSIHQYYDTHLSQAGEMQVTDREEHCHIDFYFEEEFDLRVDLIDGFDFFKNIAVKPAFLTKLFMRRQTKQIGKHSVFVPADVDELTLRYFEYLEWFDRRPDKIKHLEYICDVEDEELKRRFFENTHRFIQFKRKTWLADRPIGFQGQYPVHLMQSRRQAIKQIILSSKYILKTTTKQLRNVFKLW
jgi:hypothetical protein